MIKDKSRSGITINDMYTTNVDLGVKHIDQTL